jgi:hypothetical protein
LRRFFDRTEKLRRLIPYKRLQLLHHTEPYVFHVTRIQVTQAGRCFDVAVKGIGVDEEIGCNVVISIDG